MFMPRGVVWQTRQADRESYSLFQCLFSSTKLWCVIMWAIQPMPHGIVWPTRRADRESYSLFPCLFSSTMLGCGVMWAIHGPNSTMQGFRALVRPTRQADNESYSLFPLFFSTMLWCRIMRAIHEPNRITLGFREHRESHPLFICPSPSGRADREFHTHFWCLWCRIVWAIHGPIRIMEAFRADRESYPLFRCPSPSCQADREFHTFFYCLRWESVWAIDEPMSRGIVWPTRQVDRESYSLFPCLFSSTMLGCGIMWAIHEPNSFTQGFRAQENLTHLSYARLPHAEQTENFSHFSHVFGVGLCEKTMNQTGLCMLSEQTEDLTNFSYTLPSQRCLGGIMLAIHEPNSIFA